MVDLDQLNPQQRDAARQFEGPMMILAGAGTGKTRVVTARIAYMLSCGVAPQNIAAMTFTNKAAKEMRDRIGGMVNPHLAKKLSISTFHSFCLQILRYNPKLAGLGSTFSLVSTGDQLDLVRRVLEEKGWAGLYKAEDLLYQIGICKNWLLTPARLAAGETPPTPLADPELVATVYELYERQLRLNRAIDFDDCILKVVLLLREHPAQRERLSTKFRYLLVDEFQDTNASQFAVLEELAGSHGNICVVGDDDQSIYSWRGAMYETLERFETFFKGTKVVKLEQNYRCSNIILNAANAVIKNNLRRKDKTLWSESSSELPLMIAPFEDAVEEARWIAERCLGLIGSGEHRYKDIAILYRANAQAKLIEMALRECSLVYKTYGGQSFFERQEVREFLSYLRLVVNGDDHLALWRIINTPPRGIGLKTQEGIEALALERKKSPFAVMADGSFEALQGGKSAAAVAEFVKAMAALRARPLREPADVEALGEELIKTFQLVDHIKATSKNLLSRQRKIENLRSLPAWLRKTADDYLANHGKLNAYELLDYLTLGDAPQQKKAEEENNHISLMTIHASKGLEFPVVFIIGLEEGSLPHKNSLETADAICEERRLFYVALTRAKVRCHLTYAQMRQTGFQKESRKKSRFLEELPAEGKQELRGRQAPALSRAEQEAQRKQGTVSKLSQIRERLMRGEL